MMYGTGENIFKYRLNIEKYKKLRHLDKEKPK